MGKGNYIVSFKIKHSKAATPRINAAAPNRQGYSYTYMPAAFKGRVR